MVIKKRPHTDEREIYAINLTKHLKTGGIEKKVKKRKKQWRLDNKQYEEVPSSLKGDPPVEKGGADWWGLD